MADSRHIPEAFWRLMRFLNPRIARAYKAGFRAGGLVLLLTTTGRKTGLQRVTPLQYEHQDGVYYVGSARGPKADWFRNIQANPRVSVRIGDNTFEGIAEPITDPVRIADFLELRLERHPRMRVPLRAEGLPRDFDRADLERFASRLAMVAIRPEGDVQ